MADYFYLEPMGLGTLEVESFPSYFCRLARLHGASPATFCKHLSHWWARRSNGAILSTGRIYAPRSAMLCSTQDSLKGYVDAIQRATDVAGLHRTTLLNINRAISRRQTGLVRQCRAWCPACLMEHKVQGSPPYDRLLWAMTSINRCPIHGLHLESSCHECGSNQGHIDSSGDVSICYRCKISLVSESSRWIVSDKPSFGERDCCELVEAISSDSLSVTDDAFYNFIVALKRLVDSAGDSESFRAFAKRTLLPWRNCDLATHRTPTFPIAVRICVATGVRMVDVLSSPEESARVAGELFSTEARTEPRPRRGSAFHKNVERRLTQELSKEDKDYLTPYTRLLRELGITDGYLRYRFPNLSRKYRSRCHDEFEVLEAELAARLRSWLEENMHLYPAMYRRLKELACAAAKACGCGVRQARMALFNIRRERRSLEKEWLLYRAKGDVSHWETVR